VELEVLPAAAQYGIGIIPWSPLQGGLLGGVLKKEEARRRRGQRSQREETRGQLDAIFPGYRPAPEHYAW
jgi:aryl-alcohol dehydrogenase-like predicted oxidoreductase